MGIKKRKLLGKILISLVIIAILITIIFFGYKFFFGKEKTLEEDTFVFAILEKDIDNVEHINNLFLIDISGKEDKEVQIISIPPDLKCNVPGVSIDKIGEIYPFGDGKLIADSLSEKLGLSVGYYIIITEGYFENLLDGISPLKVSFEEDINIGEFSFMQGEAVLDSNQTKFLLNYDYNKDYSEEAQTNKLYILKEIVSNLKDKGVNLIGSLNSNSIETNIEGSYIDIINSYFLNASTIFYYDYLDGNYLKEADKGLKEVVLGDSYSNMELSGIKKFYEEAQIEEPTTEEEEENIIEEEIKETEINKEDLKIQVLNGNYIPGSATATSLKLEELGYINFDIGNVEDGSVYDNSLIYFKEGLDDFADEIGQRLGIDEAFIQNFEDETSSNFDILIIVGLDFREE